MLSVETGSGAQRSEAERSCLNTGDGCNGILTLNDGQRGENAITSSQPVHQSEREEEEEEKKGFLERRRPIYSFNFDCISSVCV